MSRQSRTTARSAEGAAGPSLGAAGRAPAAPRRLGARHRDLGKSPPTSAEKLAALVERDRTHLCPGEQTACVRVAAVADLPTRAGRFQIVAFESARDGKEHVAIIHGDVVGRTDVPTRLHSECLTGDVMGSLRCDCRDQLLEALSLIATMERGILLYLRQEGRGIGLVNKVRAYALQDQGLDTVDANLALGFRDDERDYAVAAHMLKSLDVASIQLITNNPNKIDQLRHYGAVVTARIPHVMTPNEHNRFYLETKARRQGHWFDHEGEGEGEGESDDGGAGSEEPGAPSSRPRARTH